MTLVSADRFPVLSWKVNVCHNLKSHTKHELLLKRTGRWGIHRIALSHLIQSTQFQLTMNALQRLKSCWKNRTVIVTSWADSGWVRTSNIWASLVIGMGGAIGEMACRQWVGKFHDRFVLRINGCSESPCINEGRLSEMILICFPNWNKWANFNNLVIIG